MSVHQTSRCEPELLTAPSLWWICAGMSSPTCEVLGGDTVQRLIIETNQDCYQATLPLCLPPIATQEIQQWFPFIVEVVADWRRLAAFLWGLPLETNVPAVVVSFGITWQQLFTDPQSALSRL